MSSSDWELLVLLPLASYFVSWLIVRSSIAQPFVSRWQDLAERRWIKRHPDVAYSEEWQSRLAYLPTCIWCTGFWVSGVMVITTDLVVGVPFPPLMQLACAAMIGIIDSLIHREA